MMTLQQSIGAAHFVKKVPVFFINDMQPISCRFVSDLIFCAEFCSKFETNFPDINSPDTATVKKVIP